MDSKRKAVKLYDKYKFESEYNCQPSTVNGLSKKCALICVNEILSNIPMYTGNLNPKWKFYNDVKSELEKL